MAYAVLAKVNAEFGRESTVRAVLAVADGVEVGDDPTDLLAALIGKAAQVATRTR